MQQRAVRANLLATAACGTVIGAWLTLSRINAPLRGAGWWLVILGMLLLLSALYLRTRVMLVVALLGGLLLGSGRAGLWQDGYLRYKPYFNHNVTVVGEIEAVARKKDQSVVQVRVTELDKQHLGGRVYVSLAAANDLERGDNIVVEGKLHRRKGSYTLHLNGMVRSHTKGNNILWRIGPMFRQALGRNLTPDQATLGAGILLGQADQLSDFIATAFAVSALTHLLVASGYNLTIIARFSRNLMRRYRFGAVAVTLGLIVMFDLVAGLNASLLRASLVAAIGLLTWLVGRKSSPAVVIAVTAGLTILIEPIQVYEIGWLLSFAAFAGVLILAPLLVDLTGMRVRDDDGRAARWLKSAVCLFYETLSAQLFTLPIMIYLTETVPLIGLVTNLLVAPLVPLIMLLTLLGGMATMLLPILASLLLQPVRWLLDYMMQVAAWGTTLGGEIKLGFNWALAVWFYIGLTAVILYLRYRCLVNVNQVAKS